MEIESSELVNDFIRSLVIELQERGAHQVVVELLKDYGIPYAIAYEKGWVLE